MELNLRPMVYSVGNVAQNVLKSIYVSLVFNAGWLARCECQIAKPTGTSTVKLSEFEKQVQQPLFHKN